MLSAARGSRECLKRSTRSSPVSCQRRSADLPDPRTLRVSGSGQLPMGVVGTDHGLIVSKPRHFLVLGAEGAAPVRRDSVKHVRAWRVTYVVSRSAVHID